MAEHTIDDIVQMVLEIKLRLRDVLEGVQNLSTAVGKDGGEKPQLPAEILDALQDLTGLRSTLEKMSRSPAFSSEYLSVLQDLANLMGKLPQSAEGKPVTYEFDFKRDDNGLILPPIIARPVAG
jgi:hypothetical protein